MKRIILSLCLFIFIRTEAQQINPVPDYVFSNKMSVGRNAVTDTAAYFSIGPRYGAIRGMMPPMVTDTASMSATKRNGLLIFSIQKNKYLYWDSVGSKWAEMAGTGGTAISSGDTASMLSPYIRAAGNGLTKSGQSLLVDTAAIATRARVQKAVDSINTNVALKVNISDTASMLTPYPRGAGAGNYMAEWLNSRRLDTANMYYANGRFAIGSTTTTNGVFNVYGGRAYFDTSVLVGTNTFFADEANGRVGIGTTSPQLKFVVSNAGAQGFEIRESSSSYSGGVDVISYNRNTSAFAPLNYGASQHTFSIGTTERMRLTNAGELLVLGTYNPFASSNRGNITLNGTSGNIIAFTDNTAATGYIFHAGVEMQIYNAANGNLRFFTNSIERFRLQNDGEMLINTTTDAGAYTLQVAGSIYNTNDAYFGVSSGRLGVGTSTGAGKITSIQTGVVSPTNAAYWLSHDVSASSTDGLAIGTNGSASYKWIQSYNGALSINSAGNDVLIGTTTDAGAYGLQVASAAYVLGPLSIGNGDGSFSILLPSGRAIRSQGAIYIDGGFGGSGQIEFRMGSALTNALYMHNNGNVVSGGSTDAGYKFDVQGSFRASTTITSGAPTSGSAKPWRLGEAATVSPTSPNRTIRVEIDGTVYYLHAKTTND